MAPTEPFFYIVELSPGFFLADWGGDPGRTYDRATAVRFASYDSAAVAMGRAHRLPSIDPGASRLRAIPHSETWMVSVQFSNGEQVSHPAIGSKQARALVKRYQIDADTITVKKDGALLAEWFAGKGWTQLRSELAQ